MFSKIKTVSFFMAVLFLLISDAVAYPITGNKPYENIPHEDNPHEEGPPPEEGQPPYEEGQPPEEIRKPVKKAKPPAPVVATPKVKKKSLKGNQFEGMRLEGVANATEDGGSGVAFLNGFDYKVGDEVKGYKILGVYPSHIQIENQAKHKKRVIWVNGTPSEQEKEARGYAQGFAFKSPARLSDKLQILSVRLGFDTKKVIKKTLPDLRLAADAARAQSGTSTAPKKQIYDLEKQGLLPPDFLSRQFYYRFYLDNDGVHADPRESYSKLPYFFVGQDGVIRSEKKQTAGTGSPAWENAA